MLHFNAIVTGKVNGISVTRQCQIQIVQSNYGNSGTISILDNDIDSIVFPTYFVARYQEYSCERGHGLRISGRHRKNKIIAAYSLVIIPQ